ncbi:MAG TPA: hypothetical protein VGH83_01120 [Candidatus Acidoferrum sp.]|jgi:hypothetical protein
MRPRANPVRNQTPPLTEPLAPTPHPQPTPQPGGGVTIEGGVAPLMVSSLPNIASGADVYARQFYRGSKVPFRRYLPINRQ